MSVKPVRTKKIYEIVTDSLIERLRTGELKPGDKLASVEQLAKDYHVSRSAIREALSGLRAMKLVETQHGEGTFITRFNASQFSLPVTTALLLKREDMKKLSEVRKILEVGAAGSCAIHHTKDDLTAIASALQQMKEAKGTGELGEEADLAFHLAIVQATHNQMLINLMQSVSDIMVESMRETRRLILFADEREGALYHEHQQIFQAIQAQDFDQSQIAMRNHLLEVERLIATYID